MGLRLQNTLAAVRARRKLTQSEAAALGGISRQSYSALESGVSVPSTEVALRLAAGFGVTVESLFQLPAKATDRVRAYTSDREELRLGQRVRLCRVAGRAIAIGASLAERMLSAADGVVVAAVGEGVVEIELLSGCARPADLLVVGCDPAFALIAERLARDEGVEVVWRRAGSIPALEALARGEAHIAGAHLRDPGTGEFNRSSVEAIVPFPCTRIAFADWEQGLLLGSGNPLGISGIEDLDHPALRFLNRDAGSGSRFLLDAHLSRAGIPPARVSGYATGAWGHLEVAEAIAAGLADAGIGIRAAASLFGLEHLLLETEPYELIIPDHFLELPAIGRLLELLRRPALRTQIEALGGYDAASMGCEISR